VAVVSGLARGIDSAAHQGALEGGSPTLAVMGTGLDNIYPDENKALALKIKNQGCLLTEYPPGTPPLGRNFPVRNRIISGLTMILGVIEASDKSGSLITARMALEQNRSVLVVPGAPWDKKVQGSVRLLAQGAAPLLKAEDMLDLLNISRDREPAHRSKTPPNSDEGHLMDLLTVEPTHLDVLLGRSGNWDASRLALTLLNLETLGLIERLPGNYIMKKSLCANLN
jgi:DNA processing protein